MNFSDLTSLQKRLLSAAIMIPAVLSVLYFGSWPFILLLTLLGGLALFEWVQMSMKLEAPYNLRMIAAGFVYVGISFVCCYFIFYLFGFFWSIVFLLMVWGSDSGAYFVGKTIGGPKMAVMISPNKTWSGFAGAVLTPAIIGFFAMILYLGIDDLTLVGPVMMGLTGFFVGISGQVGDLLISALKRKVEVKDTGELIPGHGGLLDRIDSMLLAAPVFLLLYFLGHG